MTRQAARRHPVTRTLVPLAALGAAAIGVAARRRPERSSNNDNTDVTYMRAMHDAMLQKTISLGIEAVNDVSPLEHCLVRFVDVSLEAGKIYKYRFKVRMMNPNYSPNPKERKDTYPQYAEKKVLTSEEWQGTPYQQDAGSTFRARAGG